MGKKSFLGLLVLVGSLVGVPAARGDVVFTQTTVPLGEVRCGAPCSHRFSFVNTGPEAVEIFEVKPSCGCVVPTLAQRAYQPEQQGSILVELTTLAQAAGNHSWPVHVVWRSGSVQHETTLTLTGTVIAEIEVVPSALTIFTDSAVKRELVVKDLRATPFQVSAVTTSSPSLSARLLKKSRDMCKIELSVGSDFPQGRQQEIVSVHTDDPLYGELRVPVTIVKEGRQRVTATPNPIVITAQAGQPIPSRIALLRDRDGEAVIVDRVEADDPAVQLRWAQGPGNQATVKVSVDRANLRGDHLESAIHIHLSKPVAETLTLPVVVGGQ